MNSKPILCTNCGKTQEKHFEDEFYCKDVRFGIGSALKFEPQSETPMKSPLTAEEIFQRVRVNERDELSMYPIEYQIKIQSGFLIGYSVCWNKLYKELKDFIPLSEHEKEVEELQEELDAYRSGKQIEVDKELNKILSVIDEIQAKAEQERKELRENYVIDDDETGDVNLAKFYSIIATCKEIKEKLSKNG